MPPSFKHPLDKPGAPIEVWLPAGFRGAPWPTDPVRAGRSGDVIARMKPGATLLDVQRDFGRINTELARDVSAATTASREPRRRMPGRSPFARSIT